MLLSLKQQAIIDIFESNNFLRRPRKHLELKEKRIMLHEQFLEFMNLANFNLNYDNKSYNNQLDNFKIIHLLDVELAVKIGVQFSLWGETIYKLGTAKHCDYIKKTSSISILGCFAMTEIGHGSNISKLETTAKYNHESRTFSIHSPTYTSHKFWIGQAAEFAQYAIVFAQLYIDTICHGVHPFVVQIRNIHTNTLTKGVNIRDCGFKNGLNSIDNGEISFNNVIIPYDNLLDKFAIINNNVIYKAKKGRFSKMLNELTKNRFGLGEGCNIISRYYLKQTLQYANNRRQFGGKDEEECLINYPTHQKRLFPLLARAIIMNIYCKNQRGFIENKEKSHISSIISKIYGSWDCLKTLQQCREACGGHGYHFNTNIGKVYRDVDIYTTFEGDNIVLLQQLFQVHLKKVKKTLNLTNLIKYKIEKNNNKYIGSLGNCIYNERINYAIFLKNIDYIIDYKTKHILLLLNQSIKNNKEPFNVWKANLNSIIDISKLLALKHILESVISVNNNYMINYLIQLFIIDHIKNDIHLHAEFLNIYTIKNIDKIENDLYSCVINNMSFYMYRLDVPDVINLNNTNHLRNILSKL